MQFVNFLEKYKTETNWVYELWVYEIKESDFSCFVDVFQSILTNKLKNSPTWFSRWFWYLV